MPLPPRVRDDVENELHAVLDDSLRYTVRRLTERTYAHGYDDGHFAGEREVRSDAQAVRSDRIENREAFAERIRAHIADNAPVWTQAVGDTPEAAVVSVADVATVMAKFITDGRL